MTASCSSVDKSRVHRKTQLLVVELLSNGELASPESKILEYRVQVRREGS